MAQRFFKTIGGIILFFFSLVKTSIVLELSLFLRFVTFLFSLFLSFIGKKFKGLKSLGLPPKLVAIYSIMAQRLALVVERKFISS